MNAIIIKATNKPFKLTLPWGEFETPYLRAEVANGVETDAILDRLYDQYGYQTLFSTASMVIGSIIEMSVDLHDVTQIHHAIGQH